VLPAEDANRGRVECEQAAIGGRSADPARGEDPQDVAVTEQCHLPAGDQGSVDDVAGAPSYLLERLAPRDRAGPDQPGSVARMAAVVRPS